MLRGREGRQVRTPCFSHLLGLGSWSLGNRTSWMAPSGPRTSDMAMAHLCTLVQIFGPRRSAWLSSQPLSPLVSLLLLTNCCLSSQLRT